MFFLLTLPIALIASWIATASAWRKSLEMTASNLVKALGFCLPFVLAASPASAQKISNLVFFGDSNTDSGRYAILPQYTTGASANVLNLHGAYTTPGGLMWSQYLGNAFGITVATTATANASILAPGGNNFAAGNARINLPGDASIGENAWSAQQQITAYLLSTGGRADANAVYVINIGTNDLKPTTTGGLGNVVNPGGVSNFAGLSTLAQQTAALATTLQAAGAKYILVPNMASAPGTRNAAAWTAAGFGAIAGPFNQTWIDSLNFYNQTTWNTIAGSGINFIPLDVAGLGDYVLLNPAQFGITNTKIATPACGAVDAINCLLANLVTPNAMNTHVFADTIGHVASVAQKIEADYVYNLMVAPSEISLLAEMPIKTRASLVETFRSHMPLKPGAVGERRVWAGGEVTQAKLANSFTGTHSGQATPVAMTIGVDYQMSRHWLLGGGLTTGTLRQPLAAGGKFEQTETAGSLYAAFRDGAVFFNALATAGTITNAVRRQVSLGITTEHNQADNTGTNVSLALQGGHNFEVRTGNSTLTHGPIAGIITQRVRIDGLTETTSGGGFTTLSFSGQKRWSAVTEIGYQASLDFGRCQPFVKLSANHELADANRVVTASLTSIAAPSYTMPASQSGRDWVTGAIGVRATWGRGVSGYAILNGQSGQRSVGGYGAAVGVNLIF